ncbi:DUF692 domain-containing protein [Blastochloris sulfoviridis]|uniref:UPF0276 protein F1193_07495 n=1 Tax=Blastochloris sulfoviridis TaxID=50712 RepID=A0A5M6I1E1_9HYPH|nr:DUF692 domain-containing protein [Blastochloris sulfoviridis]KAA5601986.1 DUF692 domain-containing protein [Blastochloris sulfoviridis]
MITPTLPARAGVGFKSQHLDAILADPGPIGFVEVHAENYMGDGGRPHAQLAALHQRFALSIHGVGLSIGADRPLDRAHLARLRRLCDRHAPESFSEHLAWSSHGEVFLNDLLPIPYTAVTLARVADHVAEVQDVLGRRMLLENPATYVLFADSTIAEVDFLAEVVRRSGCGLLLDIANVFVSAVNHGTDAQAYLAGFPLADVGEIHLAGHAVAEDEGGVPLLIDAHDSPVPDPVWALYGHVLARSGPLPTLIEWDNDVPTWPILRGEAAAAERWLADAAAARSVA